MGARVVTDDVLQAAQGGDAAALRTIYEALAPAVRGYLAAKGVTDPDGVTSEVFLAVLPRIPIVTGGAEGLRRLVFSVAHARMVDEYRERARRPAAVEYDAASDRRSVASAEADAAERLGTARVREVLAVLPDDQREVLLLRVIGDLTVEQVAQLIGRSPGAVKQLQRRGLVTLRQALAERRVTL